MKKLIAIFALILTLCAPAALFAEEAATPSPDAAAPAAGEKVLRWGGDSEGGFPYMFPDPQDPKRLIGFEVDIFAGAETPRADSPTCSPTRRTRRGS